MSNKLLLISQPKDIKAKWFGISLAYFFTYRAFTAFFKQKFA